MLQLSMHLYVSHKPKSNSSTLNLYIYVVEISDIENFAYDYCEARMSRLTRLMFSL